MKTIIEIPEGHSVKITREGDEITVVTNAATQSIEAEIKQRVFEKSLDFMKNYGSIGSICKLNDTEMDMVDAIKLSTGIIAKTNDSYFRFCKVGSLFKRAEYPNNIYALFKHNGKVMILNVTGNAIWDSSRSLDVCKLKDSFGEYLTINEFKKIAGKKDISNFKFINI